MREMLRAALVIARRDFTAVVLSRTFILFLLGPLLPILIGMALGGLGEKIASTDLRPLVGIAMPAGEAAKLERAHARLTERMGDQALVRLRRVSLTPAPREQLARPDSAVVAILSGSVAHPILTGKAEDLDKLQGDMSLIASAAQAEHTLRLVQVDEEPVERNVAGAPAAADAGGQVDEGLFAAPAFADDFPVGDFH